MIDNVALDAMASNMKSKIMVKNEKCNDLQKIVKSYIKTMINITY